MNKQEAIEKLQGMKQLVEGGDKGSYERGFINALTYALNVTKQLDEPEKPVVPQFVADYIDSEQRSCSTLSEAIDNVDDESHILDWFYVNAETFAKAWLFGYEVEKEKLYTVKFSNEDFGKLYIGVRRTASKLGFSTLPINDKYSKCYFTESELKELKFWDNPAFEIKEVEE